MCSKNNVIFFFISLNCDTQASSKLNLPNSAREDEHIFRPRMTMRRPTMRGYTTLANNLTTSKKTAPILPPGKVLMSEEGVYIHVHACVRYLSSIFLDINIPSCNCLDTLNICRHRLCSLYA